MRRYRELVRTLLEKAGITLDGPTPHDLHVHDERFYQRVLSQGSLGLGESYMEGWWSCERLEEFFCRLLRAQLDRSVRLTWRQVLLAARARILNPQSPTRAEQVARVHYNVASDFFERLLDPRMVYSCAYWKDADTLAGAQEAKLDLTCRKLGLSSGDRLLDIGCGWGSLVKFAHERYACDAVGVTISGPQADRARRSCAGLPIRILNTDYREINAAAHGRFTKVVSLGMFEHVGPKNYRTFMRIVDGVLADDGLFLLHTIGDNYSRSHCDAWLDRYIFPNGVAPSVQQLGKAIEGIFVMEDWHNFGPYYYETLLGWRDNLKRHWSSLAVDAPVPREHFLRMWEYFYASFASAFRTRQLQVWQVVLSKGASSRVYPSIR